MVSKHIGKSQSKAISIDERSTADEIGRLFQALKVNRSIEETAKEINDFLLVVKRVPKTVVEAAWNVFAADKGVM